MDKKETKIIVSKNGPYLVSGNTEIDYQLIQLDDEGLPLKWKQGNKLPVKNGCALCRCGSSKNKPFCDGMHSKINFDGTELSGREKYIEKAEITKGPDLYLTDVGELCIGAGFCDRASGTWNLVEKSDDLKSKKLAIQQACDCPSGRLVVWDKKTKKPIEPKFNKSISLIEDPNQKISGPIWVKGNIKIESFDGRKYETRNRVTLCRCGKSMNMPFCDGTHVDIGFNDGNKSIN
jgi:CDGSH-type Zn-finger protein